MKIAIFGGSFDPIHIAHEAIIKKSFEELDIDKLIVVPTYLNTFKKSFYLSPQVRYELLEELYQDKTNIIIEDFEIKQNKPTPSILTVKYILQQYKPIKLYFIIGEDNLEKLHLWDDFTILNQLVEFVVVTREGYEEKNGTISFKTIELKIDISSSQLREKLDIKYIPKKIQQKVKKIWNKQ